MLATYLIGLREGLEATLVVSILVAFLVKSQRKDRLPQVWLGVGAAVALSVLFGWLLSYTQTTLLRDYDDRELFEAVTSIAAVVFVTWMIFWMRRAARGIAGDLRSRLHDALAVGSFAVLIMAFLAVVREGLETSMIFYAAVQGADVNGGPLYALLGGIATAIGIGYLLFATAVRINLTVFFTWTGALLILVAAGIFKYGVHDLQESGVLPGIGTIAYHAAGVLDPSTWYAALLSGMFNITAEPTVLEVAAWVAYAVPVLVLFLWRPRRAAAPAAAPATEAGATAAPEAATTGPALAAHSEPQPQSAPAPAPQQ
ncbi:high-affinity iron transporter [Krasilnikovia cinnamomea]|uniref:High-affinity iron transporter n=1 Tax=Krasilnikovia cinnamomea TaxID=349313 RepID=A0A4Q7ZP60_9ACTN|nr:iron uptake transporter permease EfeU [Krasilnikovia cinnamomea]RZU52195.1 high-affinity iron transporter [Krasilnikovia cinnamomea]